MSEKLVEHGMPHRKDIIAIHCGCDRITLDNDGNQSARRCNCHIETLGNQDENALVEYITLRERK